MKIKACIINPKYSKYESFIRTLPSDFLCTGDVIYKARNELRKFDIDGVAFVVKSFKVPHIINKIAYSFLRKSKAQRSYEYGIKLLNLGIDTPEPVAYLEIEKNCLLTDSYYICLASDYTVFRDIHDEKLEDKIEVVEGVGRFAGRIQKQGIIHKDFTQGNILFRRTESAEILFALIDINRLEFTSIDMSKGCKMFKGIWESDTAISIMAKAYAQEMGYDTQEAQALILKDVYKFRKKSIVRKLFKSLRNK